MNPFEFVTAINYTKKNIMVDEETEKAYNPFMVNRSLSYFSDTVHVSNVMNRYNGVIDNRLQFDFLINIVRKRKRFSKWDKPEIVSELDAIKKYYGYSNEKAKSVLSILDQDQINSIIKKVSIGGKG
jgi:hypothetical protein